MMLSMLLAPDTPEWLLIAALALSLGSITGLLIWGTILEIRYISPYTLIKTSNREKWRMAAVLASLQTAMIPLLGLAAPIVSPLPDQWPFIPICSGLWIVLLPIAAAYKRWTFERHIRNYQRLSKVIKEKNIVSQRLFSTPFINWLGIFMTAEQKRFFREGFADDIDQEKGVES